MSHRDKFRDGATDGDSPSAGANFVTVDEIDLTRQETIYRLAAELEGLAVFRQGASANDKTRNDKLRATPGRRKS